MNNIFSARPDEWQIAFNLLLALTLGAIIGLERQLRKHPAGLHTNALVSLGAAAYVLVSLLVQEESSTLRVAAQVVSGVGFICAGVVWHEGATVRGLNTAATIWCSAAVGMLAGMGLAVAAVIAAALVLGANLVLHWIEHHFFGEPK